jgi:hypothetical protein
MEDTDDVQADTVLAPARHTSEGLFGEFGLNVATFYEYETPFDPMAAIDGD